MNAKYWILTVFLAAGAIAAMAGADATLKRPSERIKAPRSGERRVRGAREEAVKKEEELAKAKAAKEKAEDTVAEPKEAKAKVEDAEAVAKGGNEFATNLYAKLAGKEKGNVFFSPASIHTVLTMTYAGARGNTEKQMYRTLRLPRKAPGDMQWSRNFIQSAYGLLIKKLNSPRDGYDGKPAYELVVANALWGQEGYPFKKEFTQLVEANYDAGLEELDFVKAAEASREKINAWVEEKTKQKIKDLIPKDAISSDTRLVLTNAIYFKSNWGAKFEKGATRDEAFTLSAGKTVKTPMMHQQKRHGYMETATFQAVDIFYKRDDLAMTIFLPKQAGGLAAFEKTLTAKNLAKWLGQLKRETVDLTLPKFKFTSQFGLAGTLEAMGMSDAFSEVKADFSGMTTAEKLFISAVIHKAFVAVDEEGTEAAAATAVGMRGNGGSHTPVQPKVFKADHPFVFMIRHRATGSILFMGRVMNPK